MSGRFEKLDLELGTSAWGTFYRGYNRNTDFDVAVLDLHPDFKTHNKIWEIATTAQKVSHDLLATVIDFDKENGWIITERRGESLGKWITQYSIPQNVVRSLLSQFLEMLCFFEKHDFAHGDIRPETLLFPFEQQASKKTDRQYVKLAFSLGATIDNVVPTTGRDMKYIAPEMINPDFGNISPATDLYCLAFTMLELLVGPDFNRFFERVNMPLESAWVVWHGNAAEDLPAVRTLFPEIDADLEQALSAMLHKSQAIRARSAHDVLDMIDESKKLAISGSVFNHVENIAQGSEQVVTTKKTTSVWSTVDRQPFQDPRFLPPRLLGPKPWTKPWLMLQLKKPYVLWPSLSLFLVLFVFLLALVFVPERLIFVELGVEPEDATIAVFYRNDTKRVFNRDVNGKFKLPQGKHTFQVDAPGCTLQTVTWIVSKDGKIHDEKRELQDKIILSQKMIPWKYRVVPQDAELFIDGKKNQRNVDGSITLPYGSYEIVFIHPDCIPSFPRLLDFHDEDVLIDSITLAPLNQNQVLMTDMWREAFDVIHAMKPSLWDKYDKTARDNILVKFFVDCFDENRTDEITQALLSYCESEVTESLHRVINTMFENDVRCLREWEYVLQASQIFCDKHPEEPRYLVWKAIGESQLGNYDEAIKILADVYAIAPNTLEWITVQANIALRYGKYLDAINGFTQALAVDPGDASLFYKRGLSRNKSGRPQQAIEDFTMAITLDGNNADAWLERAQSHFDLGHFNDAIHDLDAAENINPGLARLFLLRGKARMETSRNSKNQKDCCDMALNDFSKAIQLEPQMEKAYEARAELYRNLKMKQQAEEDERIVKMIRNGQFPTAQNPKKGVF